MRALPRATRCRGVLALGLWLVLLPVARAHAQDAGPLATATRLKCVFPVMSTGTWSKAGDVTNEVQKVDFVLEYTSIDSSDGSAEVIGNTGNFLINVQVLGPSLFFTTASPAGPLFITSVINAQSRPGRYIAIFSKHEYTSSMMPGFAARPEQYLGECEIR